MYRRYIFLLFLLASSLSFADRQAQIAALSLDSSPTAAAWKRIGVKDHYGIDLHLLSIHTQASSGNGEFYDLLPLIDWFQKSHFDILQLLPINDTGGLASPYSPVSFEALHPIYLSLSSLPYLDTAPQELLEELHSLKSFNQTKRVLYHVVLQKKLHWLRAYMEKFGDQVASQKRYQNFLSQFADWLNDYALFKVLQDQYGIPWKKWPKELQHPSSQAKEQLKKRFHKEMTFYTLLQFLCFEQMEYVKAYANQRGVFIKGDLPFLVDVNCVEVWLHPHLFKLGYSVGLSPNPLFPSGQDWGLPPYNWTEIVKNKSALIKRRLRTCSHLYDLYRIDSCKGYFSQFEIPIGQPPKAGKDVPSSEAEAIKQGKQHLLTMMHTTDMLPIAEDIGMTRGMKAVLHQLGIPGIHLFVHQNVKHSPEDQVVWGNHYGLLSVSQLSNHDLDPLRLFWIRHPKRAQAIADKLGWTYSPILTLEQQKELLWINMHSHSLFHIELLQDFLPPSISWATQDQRINYPGTVSDRNWTYRYRLTVGELVQNPHFQDMVDAAFAPQPPHVLPAHEGATPR